jgi:amidase
VLARTVADAALLLDVIRGSHPGDRHRLPRPLEPMVAAAGRDPGRLRIGVSTTIPYSLVRTRLDVEIDAAVQELAAALGGLGHDVIERPLHYGLLGGLSFLPRSFAGLHEWREQRVPDFSLLDPRTQGNCERGRVAGVPLVRAAALGEAVFAWRMRRVFASVDVVLSPTTATPPLRVGACDGLNGLETDRVSARSCPFAWPWNVLGWPAVNLPAGFTSAGLPIGVQLLGPPGREGRLLALGAQLETVRHWDRHRPPHGLGAGA